MPLAGFQGATWRQGRVGEGTAEKKREEERREGRREGRRREKREGTEEGRKEERGVFSGEWAGTHSEACAGCDISLISFNFLYFIILVNY